MVKCPSNPFGTDKRAYAIANYTSGRVRERLDRVQGRHPGPTMTVLLYEKGANLPGSWGDALGQNVYQSHSSEGQAGYSEKMFHTDGKNFLFLDGHARYFPAGQGPFAWECNGTSGTDRGPGVCWVWGKTTDTPAGDWPGLDD